MIIYIFKVNLPLRYKNTEVCDTILEICLLYSTCRLYYARNNIFVSGQVEVSLFGDMQMYYSMITVIAGQVEYTFNFICQCYTAKCATHKISHEIDTNFM